MDYKTIKASIQRIMDLNYPDFILALISAETGIDDRKRLKEAYYEYIDNEEINLLRNNLVKYEEEFEWKSKTIRQSSASS